MNPIPSWAKAGTRILIAYENPEECTVIEVAGEFVKLLPDGEARGVWTCIADVRVVHVFEDLRTATCGLPPYASQFAVGKDTFTA